MASIQAKSEGSAPLIPFSYAQAAKGLKSAPASKAPAVAVPSPKEKEKSTLSPLASEIPPGTSWADDAEESNVTKEGSSTATTAVDAQSSPSIRSPVTLPTTDVPNGIASPPSPDFGASSTSTLAREDDTCSIPITSSESTWENKSQTSTVPEKALDFSELEPSKGGRKKGNSNSKKGSNEKDKEKAWPKPLQEAPPPQVNFWQKRAEELKSKAAVKPVSVAQPATTGPADKSTREKPGESAPTMKPTSTVLARADPKPLLNGDGEQKSTERSNTRNYGDEKSSQRREPRGGAKTTEKIDRAPKAAPLRGGDSSAWPTPDTVKNEDLKKTHDKPEKAEKDLSELTQTSAPKPKHAWEKLEFTPSPNFHTPLTGPGSRRGGRGNARGGKDEGRRAGAAAGSGEKGVASQAATTNGETSRRGRPDPAARNASPVKDKRALSNEMRKESRSVNEIKDALPKDATPGSESQTAKSSMNGEETKPTQNQQNNTFPRRENPLKPKQNRRNEARNDVLHVNGDKRKENESFSSARRTSISVQGNENGNREASVASDAGAGTKLPNADRPRASGFPSFNSGAERTTRGRGNGRGSRHSSHSFGSHQYSNNQIAQIPPYNNTPRSPNGWPQQQQDPFFVQAQQQQQSQHHQQAQHQQRVYRSGASNRPMSIPSDGSYARGLQNGYPVPNQLPPINTFVPGAGGYEYGGMGSMSAAPYTPFVDTWSLVSMVSQQMEYYFSIDNLCHDVYLRKHMDSQGFVLLTFVADFKRLKSLTTDHEMIKYVCQRSSIIEHAIGPDFQDRLRAKEGWDKWVMPMAERDPSAQNDGPTQTIVPPMAQPVAWDPHSLRQTSLPNPNSPAPASAPAYQSLNGFTSQFNGFGPLQTNEAPTYGNYQTSPTTLGPESQLAQSPPNSEYAPVPNGEVLMNSNIEHEKDSFSDEQAGLLRVVTAPVGTMPPPPARTFSNGSLDGRNIAEELAPANGPQAVSVNGPNGPAAVQSSEVRRSSAPRDLFIPSIPRRNLSRSGPISESNGITESTNVYWVKDKDAPASELPPNATSEFYFDLRAMALEQRSLTTTPACAYYMEVLYNFWSHFLIRNFNYRMYNEFRQLAADDALRRGSFVGRNGLLKYYSGALAHQEPIRQTVAQDYVDLVISEPKDSERSAFKKLRTAWRDGALNMKSRKTITDIISPELEAELV